MISGNMKVWGTNRRPEDMVEEAHSILENWLLEAIAEFDVL